MFNVALQNLEMVAAKERGDRQDRDDLEFKTHDGNDIALDVTVAWRVDPAKVGYLLARVGGTTKVNSSWYTTMERSRASCGS